MSFTPPVADEALTTLLRTYLGAPTLDVTNWRWAPLGHQIINPSTGGLYRITAEGFSHSLVLKTCQAHPHSPADRTFWNDWRREAQAYQSDLPYRLPPGATAPKLAGVLPDGDSRLHLVLEDVQGDASPATWTLAEDGALAELLGEWATIALREELTEPWLCPAHLRGMLQTGAQIMRTPKMQGIWQKPHIAPHFGQLVDRVERLLAQSEALHQVLEGLPLVLCHFDAHRGNVVRRPTADGKTEFVLLDWSGVGLGAVGEEIGHQFSASLLAGVVPPAKASELAEELVIRYTRGLAAGGAAIDRGLVRQGFRIATVLQTFGFSLPMILRAGADPANPAAVAYAPVLGAAASAFIPYLDEALSLIE